MSVSKTLIDTPKGLLEAVEHLNKFDMLVVDTETTGLEPYCGDRIIGISAKGHNDSESFYFPFRHETGKNLPLEGLSYFRSLLSSPIKTYRGFNYKFDMQMLAMDGVPFPKHIQDIQLAAHLMDETGPLSLKPLSDLYLGEGSSGDEEELVNLIIERGLCPSNAVKKAKGLMYLLAPEEVSPYACQDVILTDDLGNFYLEPRDWEDDDGIIETYSTIGAWNQEKQFEDANKYLLIFTEIEHRGVRMHRKRVLQYMAEAEPQIEYFRNKIRQLCGAWVNPGSPVQMKAQMPGITDTTRESLEDYLTWEDDPHLYGVAKNKLEFNVWSKVVSTYFRPYSELMDDNKVIHTNFRLTGTTTGRLSSNNPNLQQVPKESKSEAYQKVKKCFIARKGYTIISIDYSQAEIILGANYSKDEALISIIENGLNMHDVTAEDCGIPRFAAKTINFGVDYGMQSGKLGDKLKISRTEAQEYLDRYWKKFKGKFKLFKACQVKAEEFGRILLWNGRYLHFGYGRPSYAAMNALIQGGIAAVMQYVTLKLWEWRLGLKDPEDVHILLQVHDQFLFECKTEKVLHYAPIIAKIMEDLPTENEEGEELPFTIPMKADVSIGPSWGELVSLEEWSKAIA